MKRLILTLGLMALTAIPAASQSEPIPPRVEVEYGEHSFLVDGEEPLVACTVGNESTLDSRHSTVVVFVRNDNGVYVALGTFRTRQTGPLETVFAGDCLYLERTDSADEAPPEG